MTSEFPHDQETEDQLVVRAQQALSSCNWEIGECASQWTQKYARGRTDADFGQLIGLSGDQVYQRRRVWETFADVHSNYPKLKWSHFYVVINWEDAAECLQWANDMESTVAEMKAWRRAQHGEDLTEEAQEEMAFGMPDAFITAGMGVVQDPDAFVSAGRGGEFGAAPFSSDAGRPEMAMSAAREMTGPAGGEYTPFAKGARGDGQNGNGEQVVLTTEQVVKKAAVSLERVLSTMTPAVLEEFADLPAPLQQRLLDALDNLQARMASFV